MNIRHENVPGQLQELVFEIYKEDYAANLEAALKKEKRTAHVPGFRPGYAPMGMIKKMYEKTLLAREIDKIVNENIAKFFKDNNIKYIFEPLPVEEKSNVDFEKGGDFVFAYEYVLAPEVVVDYANLPAVVDFKISATAEERDNFINQLRERHGEYVSPESVADNDSLSVKYGEDGQDGFLFVRDLTEEAKKEIVGKSVDEKVTLAMRKAFATSSALARFLKKEEKDLEAENDYSYDLTVKHIGRINPAELNEEFFKKAYPNADITTEEQLNEEVNRVIVEQYQPDIDRQFMNDAVETLIDNVTVDFPEDFAKRYILAVSDNITAEDLDKNFDSYKRSLKWQMLENNIVEGEDVRITMDEVKEYFRQYFFKSYFSQFNYDDVKGQLDEFVEKAMANKENVKSVFDLLYDGKLTKLLRSKMKTESREGDVKDFIEMISQRSMVEPQAEETTKVEVLEEVPAAEVSKPKRTRTKKSTTEEK